MAQTPTQSSNFNSLPLEIKLATQHQHTTLNRLITARLPLCLPPQARTPLTYADGLSCFGAIYSAFETTWEQILNSPRHHATWRFLRPIYMPQLLRKVRLDRDIDALRRGLTSHATHDDTQWEAWHWQIASSILARPHVLLAYAWIMYMALFNGGHWIRAQLEGGHWMRPQLQDDGRDHLSFWRFEGGKDGEEIKEEFKTRFDEVATLLSPAERDDVVQESVRVFQICGERVAWLDEQAAAGCITTCGGFGADARSTIPVVRTLAALLSTPWQLLGSMLRSLGQCFRKSPMQTRYEKVEHVE